MGFRDLFEVKAKNNVDDTYSRIIHISGGYGPQYTTAQYEAIAKEGYEANWVIFRCLQEIIGAATQLDWVVMRYGKGNQPEEVPNHPAQHLIEHPNPACTQSEFLKRLIVYYYLAGDAPIVRTVVDRGRKVQEIDTYRPDHISLDLTGNIKQPYKNIKYKGQQLQDINPEDFILWKNFNPLDRYSGAGRGLSPLKSILKNGDLLNSFIDWNFSLLKNGAHLSGIVSPKNQLTDGEFKRSDAQLRNKHSGKDNVGKILFLDGGCSFTSMSSNPKDMDWVKGKSDTAKDICVGIGIDPVLLGFEEATYENKNEALKSLYTNKVIPLLQELADILSPFAGLQDNEFFQIKYDHIPVLQEDMKELSDKLSANSFLKINEKRVAMGKDEIEGGDIVAPQGSYAIINGKVYLPMNLVPIDEEGNPQNNKPNNSNQSSNEENNQDENKSFMY
jgi:HK97 family phage portal protein